MVARPLFALLVAFVLAGGWLAPAGASRRPSPRLVADKPGDVLVRFRPGVNRPEQAAIRRALGVRLEDRLSLARLQLVETGPGQTVGEAEARLEAVPQVAYAEPNFEYHIDAIPDDPRFLSGDQWGLNTIDAPDAWDVTTGSDSVVAAVLDTGLEYEHPDIDDNLWSNPGEIPLNLSDDDGNSFIDDTHGWDFIGDDPDPRDPNGHGTHVAGILGAQGNNTTGGTGVNWDVAIMPLRVCSAGGSCSSAAVVEAIIYAGAEGAHVANMSFGGGTFSQAQKDALDAASGTLFVASAGNSGTNNDVTPQYPCNYTSPNLICVASSNDTDGLAASSNFGATSVDLAAPGVGVLSTLPAFDSLFSDDFEGAANWDFVDSSSPDTSKWERTTEFAHSGDESITDSHGGNYGQSDEAIVIKSAPVDLGGRSACSLAYWVRLRSQAGADWLRAEAAHGLDPFTDPPLNQWSGSTTGSGFTKLTSDLGEYDGETETALRFRFTANSDTIVFDGAHVDDVEVRCAKPVASYTGSEGYAELSGTSMASPHVAGVGALLRAATPGASVAQLKAAILNTADPAPAFVGVTVTGGRLDAAGATTFITDATAPGPFDLLSPAHGSAVSTSTPTFAWQASAEPESGVTYELFVDGELDHEVSGTSSGPAGPLTEGPHTWFVRAVNGMGLVTQSSTTRSLTVDLPAPMHARTVTLKLRKHLLARGSLEVVDGFAACRQDVLVELQRKRDGGWKTVRVVTASDQGSFKSPLADRPGKYRARVAQTDSGSDVCGEGTSASVRHRH